MKKIGITGQKGFIGSHLYNRISLLKEEFTPVPFEKSFFEDEQALNNWVQQCDVIVHLAAMNRHPDQQVIHDVNVSLTQRLVNAMHATQHYPHVLFSSSTQEERDNLYGQSKMTSRKSLAALAAAQNVAVTGMIIPNVFGPFGKPFYNSVVATFCHQLTHGESPKIDNDGYLKLIYVDELVLTIIDAIRNELNEPALQIPHTHECYVSEILKRLEVYKELYLDKGIFPALPDAFSVQLFNTYRSYMDHATRYPFLLTPHPDNRGVFVELIKLEMGGQVSFSTTVPGITRGNHFHTRKVERFVVIKGKALIQLRKYNTDEVLDFQLDGAQPSYVDMPVWYTHNIKNIGEEELYTVFWINEFFDPADPDTYFETV